MANLKSNNNIDFVILSRRMACLGYCTIVFVCLFVGLMLELFVIEPWRTERGYNFLGASNKLNDTMLRGDGEQAVFWAKKIDFYTCSNFSSRSAVIDVIYLYLAKAYELNHEYDVAIHYYALAAYESEKSNHTLFLGERKLSEGYIMGRIYYKQGERQKAFEEYCRYGNDSLQKKDDELRIQNKRKLILAHIRATIILADKSFDMRLTPFLEYKDFLAFMEKEYENIGFPVEYESVMNLFRAIDKEIIDKNQLVDMVEGIQLQRKTIINERKQKKQNVE